MTVAGWEQSVAMSMRGAVPPGLQAIIVDQWQEDEGCTPIIEKVVMQWKFIDCRSIIYLLPTVVYAGFALYHAKVL
ncbi:hypothetical protein ATK17_2811 [Branchiibius hedensis]|uniref:Uncharacterized protein n=1 Tax=Branchiibius hedensis TaxID=672460 RepID=A0A2Y8ZSU5_9MICO|nr:hypothetical protein ATK17_2811 [Branchiibius hedensis]SSA35451.1 hypothetical protein SAMN04489750_2811 [Branchiibius hedensis]